jgi:chorismate dehydratase
MLAGADAAMLIGDPALKVDEARYRKFDLAGLWKKHTGLGFVFAAWMAREESFEIANQIDFATARDEGLDSIEEIVNFYSVETGKTAEELSDYLTSNIAYSIDMKMQQGMEKYFDLAEANGLI